MALEILIVEDSGVMRQMVRRTVEMTGIEVGRVVEAVDGQDGLERVLAGQFDLMLVDINMPRMNGLEMLSRAREELKDAMPAAVVVSTESSAERIAALRALGVGFVQKPFTAEAMVDAIVQALAAH